MLAWSGFLSRGANLDPTTRASSMTNQWETTPAVPLSGTMYVVGRLALADTNEHPSFYLVLRPRWFSLLLVRPRYRLLSCINIGVLHQTCIRNGRPFSFHLILPADSPLAGCFRLQCDLAVGEKLLQSPRIFLNRTVVIATDREESRNALKRAATT
jgi:hypothetical protein